MKISWPSYLSRSISWVFLPRKIYLLQYEAFIEPRAYAACSLIWACSNLFHTRIHLIWSQVVKIIRVPRTQSKEHLLYPGAFSYPLSMFIGIFFVPSILFCSIHSHPTGAGEAVHTLCPLIHSSISLIHCSRWRAGGLTTTCHISRSNSYSLSD